MNTCVESRLPVWLFQRILTDGSASESISLRDYDHPKSSGMDLRPETWGIVPPLQRMGLPEPGYCGTVIHGHSAHRLRILLDLRADLILPEFSARRF